jgi:hypothetical protein
MQRCKIKIKIKTQLFFFQQKVRAAWFTVSLGDSSWIPVLAENGFVFHRSDNPTEVTMIKWIPSDEPSQVSIIR